MASRCCLVWDAFLPVLFVALVSAAVVLEQTTLTPPRRLHSTAAPPPTAVTHVDPDNSALCSRVPSTKNDVWCDLSQIEGATLAPAIVRTVYHDAIPRTVYYTNATQLYLVNPCDNTFVHSCNKLAFTPHPYCHLSMTLHNTTAPVFSGGRFLELQLKQVKTDFLKASARTLDLSEVTAGKVVISHSSSTVIAKSSLGNVSISMRGGMQMINTSVDLVHSRGLVMNGNDLNWSYVITKSHIGQVESGGVQLDEGGLLEVESTTIGKLEFSSIIARSGSKIVLSNVAIKECSNYAFTVYETTVLDMSNVTVDGKEINEYSNFVKVVRYGGFMTFKINEESTFCTQQEGHYLCDLKMISEKLSVTWNDTEAPQSITLLNGGHTSVEYQCTPNLIMSNIVGNLYDLTQRKCLVLGNIETSNIDVSIFHIKQSNSTIIKNSRIDSLALERTSNINFNYTTINTIENIALSGRNSSFGLFNGVQVHTLHKLNSSVAINVNNSNFTSTGKIVLDHPDRLSVIYNTTFGSIMSNGVHLVRGQLLLDKVAVSSLSDDASFYIEEGAKIIIGAVVIGPTYKSARDNIYNMEHSVNRLISVRSLGQVEYLHNDTRTLVNSLLEVRTAPTLPKPGQLLVDYDLPYCFMLPLAPRNILSCTFEKVQNADVFVGHMRQNRTAGLYVANAASVTLSDTCVATLTFANVGKLRVDRHLHCPVELNIYDTAVDRIPVEMKSLSSINMTVSALIMSHVAQRVSLQVSSLESALIKADDVHILNSNIAELYVSVNQDAHIAMNNITTVAGIHVNTAAQCVIDNNVVNSFNNILIINNGSLVVSNSLIKNAQNGTIKLLKDSYTSFENVVFANFSTNILYEEGAQITMTNVTINGVKNFYVMKHLSIVILNDTYKVDETHGIPISLIELKVPSPVSEISEEASSTTSTTPYQNNVPDVEVGEELLQKHRLVINRLPVFFNDTVQASNKLNEYEADLVDANTSISSDSWSEYWQDMTDIEVPLTSDDVNVGKPITRSSRPKLYPPADFNIYTYAPSALRYLYPMNIVVYVGVALVVVATMVTVAGLIAKKMSVLPAVASPFFTSASDRLTIMDNDELEMQEVQHVEQESMQDEQVVEQQVVEQQVELQVAVVIEQEPVNSN